MISEMFALCSLMILICNTTNNTMIKKIFKRLTSQRFKKPMVNKKPIKRQAKTQNKKGGIPRNFGRGRNIYISPELETQTETTAAMESITALVFLQPETNSLVVHFTGFENEEHSKSFASKVMKKSGVDYHSLDDTFNIPTIH